MKHPVLRLALSAGLFVHSYTALAQESTNNASEEADIERLVVTATRTPERWLTTVGSIEQIQVDDQLPGLRVDMAEILAGVPGVQVDTRYNFAQDTRIILRGFGARAAFGVRGVLMRLDGIPLSMPDGQAQTSSIFVDEPRHVEVLRGPVAGLYGNAAGGIINLESALPQGSYLQAEQSVGENGRRRSRLSGAFVDGPFSVTGHVADFKTDGDRPQAAAERRQYALRSAYQFSNGIEFIVRADDNDAPILQDPGSLTVAQWRDDPTQTFPGATTFDTRKRIRHRQQSITLRQRAANIDWQIAGWHGRREVEQYLPFPGAEITSSGAVIDLTRDFYGVHAQVNWRPAAFDDQWQLILGTDIERQEDTRLGFVNDFGNKGDRRRDETGTVDKDDLYVISQYDVTERINWMLGTRHSRMAFNVDDRFVIDGVRPDDSGQTDYRETTWSTGLNYQLTDSWSIFIAGGESFETPTLTELAYRNDGPGLNPALTPAKVRQAEFGHKWATESGNAQISVFEIQSDDEIVVDQSNDGRTTYRNAGQTKRQGIEWSGRYQWTPTLEVRGAATVMKARYEGSNFDGQRIPGIATSNLFGQLNFRPWRDDRLRASLAAQYRSRVAANDDNTDFAPSYTVWQAALEAKQNHGPWQFKQWLRVDNLLDKTYVGSVVVNQGSGRVFEPAPGRQLSAGVGVTRHF